MSISLKNDYSYLFSGLNNSSSNSVSNMSWLSDYASIKSGSYGKLMKAYYSSEASGSDSKTSTGSSPSVLNKLTDHKLQTSTVSDETKAYNKAATSADALQTSIKELGKVDSDTDDDKIYDALSSYVKNYNSVIDTASATSDATISNRATSIKTTTAANEKALNSLGISIGSDGKLSINKDTFDAADKSSVRELFADKRSYASNVAVSAAMIQSTANYDSARSSTYTAAGSYSSVVGSLWDSTT